MNSSHLAYTYMLLPQVSCERYDAKAALQRLDLSGKSFSYLFLICFGP
jgi:hypothetical protein